MEYAYRWRSLRDLADMYAQKSNSELATLRSVWIEQKGSLEAKGIVGGFTTKLVRELAIEGGILERAYTLDRGVTIQLIEHGIEASLIPQHATNRDPKFVAALIQDHLTAAEGIFDWIKSGRNLTVGLIKQLHSLLMRHQTTTEAIDQFGNLHVVPMLKGEYKQLPNNPRRQDDRIHEYCPPEHVASEMEQLLRFHAAHMQSNVSPEVEAAWIHHAFTQIHPFQDGNGRIARLLATYVFVKSNCFPLVLVDERDRKKYIDALEIADESGNLTPLIDLFSTVQRNAFVKVLSLAGEVQRDAELDQMIESAARKVDTRIQAQRQRMEQAKTVGRRLMLRAEARLEELNQRLSQRFSAVGLSFQFFVHREWNEGDKRFYFRAQVIDIAKKLDYFANPSAYHDWIRLVLRSDEQAEILITLHGVGHEYRGLLAISAIFFRRSRSDEGSTEITAVTPLNDSMFQVSYLDTENALEERFDRWMEEAARSGLAAWQQGL